MSDTVIGTMRTVVKRVDTDEVVYDELVFNSEAILFKVVAGVVVAGVEYELAFHFDPPVAQIPAEPVEDPESE